MDAARDELAERLLRHRAWLAALARALVRDAAEADDIVQATWAVALANPPRGPLRPWLAAVARRLALLVRRGAARRRAREERVARSEALPATDALVERLELEERLVRELRALAEPLRGTLVLRYQEGLSAAEIARREGVPEGTVRWRCKRGLDELRARMERACGGRDGLVLALAPLWRGRGAAGGVVSGGMLVGIVAKWGLGAALVVAVVALAPRPRVEAVDGRAAEVPGAELASAAGPGSTEERPALASNREPVSVPSSTSAAGATRVVVREHDGTPLAGMRVEVRSGDEPAVLARLDERGALALDGAGPCALRIERAAAFPYLASVTRTGGEQELRLPRGAVLAGRVVVDGAPPDRPLAVALFPAWERSARSVRAASDAFPTGFATAYTDEGGALAFHGLEPGGAYDLALPEGYARPGMVDGASIFRDLVANGGHVLEVVRRPRVHGRVLRADGSPPEEALVQCRFTWMDGTNADHGATTDAAGRFEIFVDEPWRSVSGWIRGVPDRSESRFSRTREAAPDGDLGDLVLARGRTVALCVRDIDGAPIEGACTDLASRPTDAHGATWLHGVTASVVRVGAPGYGSVRAEIEPGAEALDVALARTPRLSVAVVDAAGRPVPLVGVELSARRAFYLENDGRSPSTPCAGEREGRHESSRCRGATGEVVSSFRTSSSGLLDVSTLAPGIPLELAVLRSRGDELWRERLAPLGAEEWREVVITLAERLVSVSGVVRDDAGEPLAGATVGLRAGAGAGSSVRTDFRGRFELQALDGLALELTVTRSGFLETTVAVTEERALDVELRRGPAFRVRLVAASGTELDGAWVRCRERDGARELLALCIGPGLFELAAREGGEYVVSAGRGNARVVRDHSAHEPELVLALPATGVVAVAWELPPGVDPAELAALVLRPLDPAVPELERPFVRAHAGTHRFVHVLPGEYELRLRTYTADEELVWARQRVSVRANATSVVAIGAAR